MVKDEEVYGRFIMFPRHFKKDVIGDKFISLRPVDKGGISGFILSRLKKGEDIGTHKSFLENTIKPPKTISSMGTAPAKDLRGCSLDGVINIDVILTQETFPYHAEIQFFSGPGHTLIVENLRSPEFMYVCDQIKSILLKGSVAV